MQKPRQLKQVIKVFSDNFDGAYMTRQAYEELRLQMNTGDFHTHRIERVRVDFDETTVITVNQVRGE